ncbi:MAG: chloride channel protein [Clostridiales bacterium]|nr:chloride channel protein [Clostridiales bacterium]
MKKYQKMIICSLLAMLIGAIVGATAGVFGQLLHLAEEIRSEHYIYIVPFLGIAGVGMLFLYKHISPPSEQGLNLAIAYNMGKATDDGKVDQTIKKQRLGKFPKAYAPLKLVSNLIMLFFGASTGKEGSFAAFGASIGDYLARITKSRRYSHVLLISGVAAAVSGLFQTPLGGMFFALEFTVAGVMVYSLLIPTFICAFTAYFFSKLCGYTAFYHAVSSNINLDVKNIISLVVASLVFGLIGKAFAISLNKAHQLYRRKVKNRYLFIFITGSVMAGIFILLGGRYCGTGANIISGIFNNGTFQYYDFALKFIFTIICISAGFTGGEMMPLLTIGATLGALMASVTGLPLELAAAMGCVAVYASATNTLVAPIFIGIEMFGTDAALYVAAACIIAYATNGKYSVYTMQGHITKNIYRRLSK